MTSTRRTSARLNKNSANELENADSPTAANIATKERGKRARSNTTSAATSASKKSRTRDDVEMEVDEEDEVPQEPASAEDGETTTKSNIRSNPKRAATKSVEAPVKQQRRTTEEVQKAVQEFRKEKTKYNKLRRLGVNYMAHFENKQAILERRDDESSISNYGQLRKYKNSEAAHTSVDEVDQNMADSAPDLILDATNNLSVEGYGDTRESDEFEADWMSVDDDEPQARKKTARRGETRGEIEALKKKMKEDEKKDVALKPKKVYKQPPTKSLAILQRPRNAAGLSTTWTQKMKATPARASNFKARRNRRDDSSSDVEVIGGFGDDDVAGSHPKSLKKEGFHDNVIAFVSDGEDEERPPARKTPAKVATKAKRGSQSSAKAPPPLNNQQIKVKAENRPSKLPGFKHNDRKELPAFLGDGKVSGLWQARVLPTLYHLLYTSEDPFEGFTKGSDQLLQAIQRALDDSIPGNTYHPTKDSYIMYKGYERLADKRSLIGSSAVTTIDDHIRERFSLDDPDVVVDPADIVGYVGYAIDPSGPAFWATPVPERLIDHERAPKPRGLFESSFILDTVKAPLRHATGSQGKYGEPISAIALAVAAVERAFNFWITGTKTEITRETQFNSASNNSTVLSHLEDSKRISEGGWKRIKGACGLASIESKGKEITPASAIGATKKIAARRGKLFIPSSPPPEAVELE